MDLVNRKKTWLGPSWPHGTPPGQNRWIPARPSVGSPPDDHDDGKYEYCTIFCVYIFGANQSECVPLVFNVFSFGVNQAECILLVSGAYNVGV